MEVVGTFWRDVDLNVIVWNLFHLSLAYILALPVGWHREKHERSAGLRTFPLVSAGACSFVLVGQTIGDGDGLARVFQGVISGIGFIGGGAILKMDNMVVGTATAAAIWATAGIGASVALTAYEIAITLSLVCFLTFFLVSDLKLMIDQKGDTDRGKRDAEDD